MGSLSKAFHSVGLGDEEVFCLSFSPFEWSKSFLAIGTENKVVVANVQLQNVSRKETVWEPLIKKGMFFFG